MKKVQITITLDEESLEILDRLAEKHESNRSMYLRYLLKGKEKI